MNTSFLSNNTRSPTMTTQQQPSPSDTQLTTQLIDLRTQLSRKQTFEPAIKALTTLLIEKYPTSSKPVQSIFYDVVCRAIVVIRTRYTAPSFLLLGTHLLECSLKLITDNPFKISHLRDSLSSFQHDLAAADAEPEAEVVRDRPRSGGGYLFEGHLTVDQEPPQPNWLVQMNFLNSLALQEANARSETREENRNDDDENNTNSNNTNDGNSNTAFDETMSNLYQGMFESLDESMIAGLEALAATQTTARVAPPASKEAVAKLPVVKVDEEVLRRVGEDAECCICKEKLVVGDEMQELPCKHLFHPLCLKPWFDQRNSCPICRHELPTDDHKYESRKEREKELEEERRGAANALRGGEFMYI